MQHHWGLDRVGRFAQLTNAGRDGYAWGSEVWGYYRPTHTEYRLAYTRYADPNTTRYLFPRVINGRLYYQTIEQVYDPVSGHSPAIPFVYEQTLPVL